MELNELNKNAKGGTELMADRLYEYVDRKLLDEFQIVQSRVRELDPKKKKIYWVHDLHADPEVQHLKDGGWNNFDMIVFVSHWQQQMYNAYLGVPFSVGRVLQNAIKPITDHEKPNDKIRLIYYSTPHRGLELLYPAFDELCKHYDDVELTVYSSFGLYGWPQRDEPYKNLFKALEDHPKVRYSGAVSNKHIRNELKNHHIFAYPSIWQETSCLCLIEALSAGLECVHSSLAALPETSMSLSRMYQYTEDKQVHLNTFYKSLVQAVEVRKQMKPDYQVQKMLVNHRYNWENRAKEWTNLLTSLL